MSTTIVPDTIRQPRPKAGLRNRLLRWGGRMLLLCFVLVLIGASYQALATVRDAQTFPPPGQLVDVGGYKLHIHCMGEGAPTVILESGQANNVAVWAWVQPTVAKVTRVCAYDRAGVGWSERSPHPRTAQQMATELHTLLTNAGIAAPYLLVAHSFGGLVTHVYAAQYRADVVGLVWLDVEHPEQWTRTTEGQAQYEQIRTLSRIGPWFARLGLVRLSDYFPLNQDLPPQAAAAFKAWVDTTRFMTINAAEFDGQLASAAQAQAAGSLGALPLLVLTATDHGYPPESAPAMEEQWLTMQSELAALSTNSQQQIVPDSTHGSLQVEAADAQITSDAIVRLVAAVRSGKALTAP